MLVGLIELPRLVELRIEALGGINPKPHNPINPTNPKPYTLNPLNPRLRFRTVWSKL